jgi:hypothetical protein
VKFKKIYVNLPPYLPRGGREKKKPPPPPPPPPHNLDLGSRKELVVSAKPWPHDTRDIDPLPVVQETLYVGASLDGSGNSHHTEVRTLDGPARSESL